jgi:hypothetical protein
MVTGDIVELIAARAAQAERQDLENEAVLPHLVACTDTVSGHTSYSGPYHSRAAAHAAAEYETAVEADAHNRLRFSVEPVFPPIGYHLNQTSLGDVAL